MAERTVGAEHVAADPAAITLEAGRLLFARPARFMQGVARLDQLPPVDLPEVAFAGRSNVGKSSLVNAVTGRTLLARVSNTPGRTQELNFFDIAGRLILVDLPGYGYARAPKETVEAWTRLVFGYLRGRPSLRLVILLVDARHGLKPNDLETMDVLAKAAVPFKVVLTKTDLLKRGELVRQETTTREALKHKLGALAEPLSTSSRADQGVAELRAILEGLAPPLDQEPPP